MVWNMRDVIRPVSGFLTRSETNQPVQSQKMARSLKFCIYEKEGLCFLCSKKTKTHKFVFA